MNNVPRSAFVFQAFRNLCYFDQALELACSFNDLIAVVLLVLATIHGSSDSERNGDDDE